MRVNCGTVGISNLTKRHRGKKKCLELKARRDKKGNSMVQGTLLTFMKPKPTMVPPTVAGTSLIHSNMKVPTGNTGIPFQWEFEDGGGRLVKVAPVEKAIPMFTWEAPMATHPLAVPMSKSA
jgi:hypothetical protein